MHHCWNRMTCRQQNPKTSIQMFRNLLFVTPLWDDAYAIQGRTRFPCFKWLKMDNSQHKESGTLLLKSPTSFLIWISKHWGPLFLKEGGMIHPSVGMIFYFDRFNIDFDKSEPKQNLDMFHTSTCSVDINISTQLRQIVSMSSSHL